MLTGYTSRPAQCYMHFTHCGTLDSVRLHRHCANYLQHSMSASIVVRPACIWLSLDSLIGRHAWIPFKSSAGCYSHGRNQLISAHTVSTAAIHFV